MVADDDGKRPIFTGEDLPDEPPIPSEPEPQPVLWDDGRDFGAAPAPTSRLSLDDDHERLPWLESADDIDADEGFDSGRVIGFILLSLLALGMIVAAVWYVTHQTGANGGDGSLIAAQPGPYKVPPENPGGKTFEGTGDTSFAVAQGESEAADVAGDQAPAVQPPVPEPSATAVASATATPKPAPPATSPAVSGVGVQVGAYTSAADAEKGWSSLSSRHSDLSGLSHRVIEGQADFGRVFRLQAVTGDLASANALCARLKAAGQGCQVKR